eukprot:CAMPEP_0171460092 /NCGR_PEP_ID=MMETSP0945-20130129/5098_1 /TAXON_ID=109269 /ORGANISM="Vaucheria litorea, Strain CCMP2940" /LENGTH=905 /DNA_ID=CAMNT_0011986209 /DNA_START=83 /DNA_END=2800 /DNA_ORIENTATION=+
MSIKVPSKDREPSKDPEKSDPSNESQKQSKSPENEKAKKAASIEHEEMNEEDRLLKEGLELAVARASEADTAAKKAALAYISKVIRSATTSMTSVPKPLKFLRSHYNALESTYQSISEIEIKKSLADILSILAMTSTSQEERASLKYKLNGNMTDLGQWGHEYLRTLAGQIGEEYTARVTEEDESEDKKSEKIKELMILVDEIVPFHLKHNAEAEAVDLLVEVQCLNKLNESPYVDEKNYERVCLYLIRLSDYMSDPDDLLSILKVAYQLYLKQKKYVDALRVALKMDDMTLISNLFSSIDDEPLLKQMALLLGRHRSSFVHDDESLNELIGNATLNENFLLLAKDLDVIEPKTPEDIYKSHLAESAGFSRRRDNGLPQVDSARANLASTFVNAFVNCGYGQDSLMTPEGNNWLYKNKDHGMLSAAASMGMILMWNVEEGLAQIDKFLYTNDTNISAGAALAMGIVCSGVKNESDPAMALLTDHIEGTNSTMRIASICGLGIAYAGSRREDVMELLVPVVANTENSNMVEIGLASLSLGLVFVGTCNDDVSATLAQRLMESTDTEMDQSMSHFISLGLGLLYLEKQEKVDVIMEVIKTVEHPIGAFTEVVLESCAYAGTGNVLKVQEMLHMCAEHLDEKADFQAAAVIGIAMVAMGEDVGTEMAIRTFDHLLHYGGLPIKRAVPLALALMHVGNPDYSVVDQLSRLTHDGDTEVAQSAILALGIVSSGTNNSRVAQLLRQLSEFYSREAGSVFMTRIAQGLNHLGKGLLTIHPFHSDRLLLSPVALGGVLAILFACLDARNTILDEHHYILYFLSCAIHPRMLITVDEELQPLPVIVRVGQAVETVGQAGRPKTITGFQTHTSPVLLGVRDRAELVSNEYRPVGGVLEGIVILQKIPENEIQSDV